MPKHANIAVFVPHAGCSYKCSFCNQNEITGITNPPDANEVKKEIESALINLKTAPKDSEIAFFGGSFTMVERSYMLSLLEAAYPFVKDGSVSGIRISTRPDGIDDEILGILKEYGVTTVELGAQSMDNKVLLANGRGHTAEDVIKASKLIKKYGFSLGLQIMTGLYKSTPEKDFKTALKIIKLNPQCVRIYPTVVLKNSKLAEHYENGEYVPQTLEESVEICAKILLLFEKSGIDVLRVGLHDSQSLCSESVAGAYHPAFRELCESKIFENLFVEKVKEQNINNGDVIAEINPKSLSKFIGQRKTNLVKWEELGYNIQIKLNQNLDKYELDLEVKQCF
ncbi:MAG: radical SAM protein [Bacillota bacterium]|nr:radical SAM protein [Bacillota bacterium]